jgi:hypothetical protein
MGWGVTGAHGWALDAPPQKVNPGDEPDRVTGFGVTVHRAPWPGGRPISFIADRSGPCQKAVQVSVGPRLGDFGCADDHFS